MARDSISELQYRAMALRDDVRQQWDALKALGMTEEEVHEAFHSADKVYMAFRAADCRASNLRGADSLASSQEKR